MAVSRRPVCLICMGPCPLHFAFRSNSLLPKRPPKSICRQEFKLRAAPRCFNAFPHTPRTRRFNARLIRVDRVSVCVCVFFLSPAAANSENFKLRVRSLFERQTKRAKSKQTVENSQTRVCDSIIATWQTAFWSVRSWEATVNALASIEKKKSISSSGGRRLNRANRVNLVNRMNRISNLK